MKRTILAITLLLAVSVCFAQTKPAKAKAVRQTSASGNWQKTKDNSWPGYVDGQPYRYKLDGRKLMWSADAKNWQEDPDGMWGDKEGAFFKLDGRNLMWSPDGGNTWQDDLPEWKWQAIDDRWYKVDKEGTVWVNKSTK